MNEGIQQLLPNILKVASVEDRQASSKALSFLPMLLAPIGEFAMGLGDIGIDATVQKEGLFSSAQQNKWGGYNHDSSGQTVYTDANGTVIPKPKLDFAQQLEKLSTTEGIKMGTQTLPGMGIDKGLDKLDDKLAESQQRFEGSEQHAPKQTAPKQGSKDPTALTNAANALAVPIVDGKQTLDLANDKLTNTRKFADNKWSIGTGRKDKKAANDYADTLEQQRKVSIQALKAAEDAKNGAGATTPTTTVESLHSALEILKLHTRALQDVLNAGTGKYKA
jgi:hypothetical protein